MFGLLGARGTRLKCAIHKDRRDCEEIIPVYKCTFMRSDKRTNSFSRHSCLDLESISRASQHHLVGLCNKSSPRLISPQTCTIAGRHLARRYIYNSRRRPGPSTVFPHDRFLPPVAFFPFVFFRFPAAVNAEASNVSASTRGRTAGGTRAMTQTIYRSSTAGRDIHRMEGEFQFQGPRSQGQDPLRFITSPHFLPTTPHSLLACGRQRIQHELGRLLP